jgi:hypothetical protein
MIKITLGMIALLLAMAQNIHADTTCIVTKSIPTYKTVNVKTPHITTYQVSVNKKVQCGVSLVDIPNSNSMKTVPKYCNKTTIETKHKTTYTYKEVKTITKYTNYFRYLGKQYKKDSETPLKEVIVR